jgi:hypothetical protein
VTSRLLPPALALALIWASHARAEDIQRAPFAAPELAGLLTDTRLVEFSGIAPSVESRRFWAINDGGQAAILWQINERGKIQGEMLMSGVTNVDFEDITSFTLAKKNYVAVGDIGDNAAVMPNHNIYVMSDALSPAQAPLWTVRYHYPDGPHDAESLMANAAEGVFYIVNKRVSPPILYRVPMHPKHDVEVTAERIGALEGIPVADSDVDDESNRVRFASQPTGAVLGCDGNELLLLTYASVYRYRKTSKQSWAEALSGQTPQALPLPPMVQAEAITLSKDCRTLYVGGEKIPGALWRFKRTRK